MGDCSAISIEYAWPACLVAGRETRVDVCIHILQPQSTALIALAYAGPPLTDQQNDLTSFESQVVLPDAGFSTLRFSFAPQHAGATLKLAINRRAHEVIPLLALPQEAASEVSLYFDHLVKTRCAARLEPQQRVHAAAGTSAGELGQLPAKEIEQQNLLVGKVYRQQLLPMLLDMQTVLQDAPYHELRGACMRLTPQLHAARMHHCISVLREVIQGNNDFSYDLLALPTAQINASSQAPEPTIEPSHATPSTGTLTKVTDSSERMCQLASAFHSLPSSTADQPDVPWERLSLTITADDQMLESLLSEEAPAMPPTLAPFIAPAVQSDHHDDHLSRAVLNVPWHGSFESLSAAEAARAQQTPQPGLSGMQRMRGMHGMEYDTGMVIASADDDTASLHDLLLTSFVPTQHDHISHNVLQMLVDPDDPPSRPRSGATSIVGSIVAASQGHHPNSVYLLQSGPNSDSSSVLTRASTLLVGSTSCNACQWSSAADASGDSRAWHAPGRVSTSSVWSRTSMSSTGEGVSGGLLRGWAGLLPPRPGPLPTRPGPPSSSTGVSSDSEKKAPGTNSSSFSLGPGVSQRASVAPTSDDQQTNSNGSGGHVSEFTQGSGCSMPCPDTSAATAKAPRPAPVGAFSFVKAISGQGRSSKVAEGPPPSQLPTTFLQSLGCSWSGFKEPVLEDKFRLHWASSCWLVDATTLGLTGLVMLTRAAGLPDSDMLVALVMPVLLAGFLLLLVHGQAAAAHREAVITVSRIVSCAMWVAAMHGLLLPELGLKRQAVATLTTRLAIAHLKNMCRPLLLWPAMLATLVEALCIATLAPWDNAGMRLVEVLVTCTSALAISAAMDAAARQSFAAMQALHSKLQAGAKGKAFAHKW